MSLNDKDTTLGGPKGVDIYPGIANPTKSSDTSNPMINNFVSTDIPRQQALPLNARHFNRLKIQLPMSRGPAPVPRSEVGEMPSLN